MKLVSLIVFAIIGGVFLAGCSGGETTETPKGVAPEVTTDTNGALPPEQRGQPEDGEASR